MGTRPETLAKRQRVCTICGSAFAVKKTDYKGTACSLACLSELRKRAVKAARADPARNAAWDAAARRGVRKWHADPANAAAASKRSSDHMKRMHADPEFQARRDIRSSRVMKENWEKHRDLYEAQAFARYWRLHESELGLNSPEAKERKAVAAQWIMTKAQEALRSETNYCEVFSDVANRLRREMPYDGPKEGSDYFDYLQKLDRAICTDPEIKSVANAFLSRAIPRFAKQWAKLK